MIVDCFPFFNEFDLLELRLRMLERIVDRFVLVEAPFTQRGDDKPLYFSESAERFAPWRERIVHLVCPGPARGDPWANEYAQRDYLATVLSDLAATDVVLMGDCDEIVDPASLAAAEPAPDELVAFEMRPSMFYANFTGQEGWIGTRAFRAGSFAQWGSMSRIRHSVPGYRCVPGGWHLTWLGGIEAVHRKLAVMAHTELAIPYYRDPRRLAVMLARGCWFDGGALRWRPTNELPGPLAADPARWSAFLCPRPAPCDAERTRAELHAHGCCAYVPAEAAQVVAVADDSPAWEATGRERFGDRFGGAAADIAALGTPEPGTWLIVDALERRPLDAVFALGRRCAGVVAFARNARSLAVLNGVLRGQPFPPGAALGWRAIAEGARRAGLAISDRHIIREPSTFVPSHALADGTALAYDALRYDALSREQMLDLLTSAFVVVAQPGS